MPFGQRIQDGPLEKATRKALRGYRYQTTLDDDEAAFHSWVAASGIPFDPSPTADYDMRGFFKAMKSGDPVARTALNASDGLPHFPDKWKTPFHKTFSNESMYADDKAPRWEGNKLIAPDGRIVFEE